MWRALPAALFTVESTALFTVEIRPMKEFVLVQRFSVDPQGYDIG